MSLEEIKNVVSEASDMIDAWAEDYDIAFSRSMNVTGGEPLLHPDLFEVLAEIKKRGFSAFLLTNGTLLEHEQAGRLADLGIDGVQVSIEGPEAIHDSIRGTGSFAASAAGIEHLADAGLPVSLNVTLSRLNASAVKDVIAFGSRVGAARIGFSRLVPAGSGRSLLSRMLKPAEIKELYEDLLSAGSNAPEIVTGDPVASQLRTGEAGDGGNVAVSGCAAGVAGLTLHPDGNVTPCRRLPLSLGNVRTDSLRDIWSSSPILGALRDRSRYGGKCGACSRWARCRGCRAIAYAYARSQGKDDFLAEDPQCFIEA